jgi:hypothetical protein
MRAFFFVLLPPFRVRMRGERVYVAFIAVAAFTSAACFFYEASVITRDHPYFLLLGGFVLGVIGIGALLWLLAHSMNNNLDEAPPPNDWVSALHVYEDTADEHLCAICLDVGNRFIVLPCGHEFHTDCALSWFERRVACPVCLRDPRDPPPDRRPSRENAAPQPAEEVRV